MASQASDVHSSGGKGSIRGPGRSDPTRLLIADGTTAFGQSNTGRSQGIFWYEPPLVTAT
jgi:hypothetical protein